MRSNRSRRPALGHQRRREQSQLARRSGGPAPVSDLPASGTMESTVELLGVPVWRTTEQTVVETVLEAGQRGDGGWLCPINLDVLRQINNSNEIRDLVSSADLVVADGMPLVWASRVARMPLPERVAGSTLVTSLTRDAATVGSSVFLLGGNDGTADKAATKLQEQNPDLTVAGTHCPPFGFEHDEAQMNDIRDAIEESQPDIIFVGLGFPKQDHLIQRLRKDFPNSWFVSCGITFSFVAGEIQRAPRWIQVIGMEWIHRMLQEPRRLVRRYLVDGLPFFAVLAGHAVQLRFRPRGT